MSVWSSVKQALGTAKGRAADSGPMPPTFERLEERILLSADPMGLWVNDPSDDDGITESAIVIDFDPTDPATQEGSGSSAGDPTTDIPSQITPAEQPPVSDPTGLTLSQVGLAAGLAALVKRQWDRFITPKWGIMPL